jgi:hypothetical protein
MRNFMSFQSRMPLRQGGQLFCASRCFARDFRRSIRALAARRASVRVRGFFTDASPPGFAGLAPVGPAPGIIGSICVGAERLRSMGCIPMGPA